MMRAVDAIMECLKAEGVDVVFGYPGGANLPTYDAMYDSGIRHILVRHEAGGGHAAEGYAKASGKVGVCFATSGPGATNIVTPLTDAMMDSVPVVFFTGQVRTDLLGTDGFQEADTFGITMPIVKHSFMIQHPLEIPRVVHEAFHIARTGRPGPVLIDMPADLIVAVGARFDDRITGKLSEFAPRAKFIHIDIDPAEISKNVPAHIPIVGDAKNILGRLLTEYRGLQPDAARLSEWWERIEQWRAQHPRRYDDSPDTEIKPQFLVQALYEATDKGDCILATDIGQHQMWAAQYFHFSKPRRWIQSGGLGTMGFGLPAAMGAAVAQPDLRTIVLSGDASIQMNMQELSTLATYGIPVKVVIMNNGYLGMVRQWQELFWDRRYSAVEMSQWPDFVKLAEAMGCHGVRLADKTTLVDDLRAALALDGPVVVDARVTKEESVYPMIAPGQAARDMVG